MPDLNEFSLPRENFAQKTYHMQLKYLIRTVLSARILAIKTRIQKEQASAHEPQPDHFPNFVEEDLSKVSVEPALIVSAIFKLARSYLADFPETHLRFIEKLTPDLRY